MQGPPQRGVVAKLGIADDRRDVQARRAYLPPQRQRELPLRAEHDAVGNAGPHALARRQPGLGQVEVRAHKPGTHTGPQRDGHRDLAVGRLAERPAVLPGDADRGRALLGETRAVENQHAAALGDDGAQSRPQRLGVPRRMRDEVLKRLVGPGIAQAGPHRFHRLAATVVEQAGDVAPHRPALTLPTEAVFEELQPRHQPTQPCGRCAIEHCAARYRQDGALTNAKNRSHSFAKQIAHTI